MKNIPVTCQYAGSPELIDKVTQAIQVHQNNPKAIAFGIVSARLLEAILLGAPLGEALATLEQNFPEELKSYEAKEDVVKAFANGKRFGQQEGKSLDEIVLVVSHEMMKDKPDSPFYNLYGRSCALPGSFIGPIAQFYKCATKGGSTTKDVYAAAIRENILASGDTCSRAIFVGATLAAAGVSPSKEDDDVVKWDDAIPEGWFEKMDQKTMDQIGEAIGLIIGS